MKRTHNEDNLYLLGELNLFVVADGMGGHSSGEVASQIAVESIAQFFRDNASDDEVTWPYKGDKKKPIEFNLLDIGVRLANSRIYEKSSGDERYRGMGTTVVSVYLANQRAYIGHVGDSRVYMLRGNTLKQMTEDHSLLNDYIKAHNLTPEEIENFPHKNVIVRALGMKETVKVDVLEETVQPGDIFLLCSDGLSGMVNDNDIAQILSNYRSDLNSAVKSLIDRANQAGGTDNVTVALCRIDSLDASGDRTLVSPAPAA